MYPSLLELLTNERERSNFVAFATSTYAQEEVLFLAAVLEFNSAADHAAVAGTIMREYLVEGAPHAVKVSQATRREIEKRLKQGKKLDKLFEAAWNEVQSDLPVYQRYEERWLKDLKVDLARRRLIKEIEFDLDNPPSLSTLLTQDTFVRQLQIFSESIFCEEIVSFFSEATAWKKNCNLERGRQLVEKVKKKRKDKKKREHVLG